MAASAARQRAIESNDRVILIFDRDAANETVLGILARGRYVEHQTADVAKEFAAHVIKLIVGLVKAVFVQIKSSAEIRRAEIARRN